MTLPSDPRLQCHVADRIATLTLNVPDRLNPLDHGAGSLQRLLVETLEHLDEDPDVGCSVITGAGRAFSAGGDMSKLGDLELAEDFYWFHVAEAEDNERIRRVRKPTIGAINGICYGAGLIMAVHFDLLVAAESAKLGLIETRFGGTGVNVLAYHVGPQWAKFLALSGEVLTARKAAEIGLVLLAIPDDVFPARVRDLARRVAALPPAAAQLNRRVVNGALDHMGWGSQDSLAIALNSIASAEMPRAHASDGRLFSEIRETEGWAAYKHFRDEPFREPWLSEDAGPSAAQKTSE